MKKLLLLLAFIPTLANAQTVTGFILNGGVGKVVADSSANPHPVTCISGCSGGGGGGGAVYGPTPVGSASANPPVQIGGTTDGTATGPISTWLIDSSGSGRVTVTNSFNLEATQLLLKADLDALAAAIGGTGTVQGTAASGASVSGNPLLTGCRAATAAPTAVTNGQAIAAQCGAEGALVTRPYAVKELMVRKSTGAMTSTTQTSIIPSAGGSLKNYITAIQCSNSGTSTSILTFTDDASTVLINPASGGGSWTFPVPLATAAATAFQVTPGTASTSQYCSAQGYTGL